jgi:hypothetical protein
LANHPITIIQNTIKHYQGNLQPVGKSWTISGSGDFSDTIGALGFDYQVKAYRID